MTWEKTRCTEAAKITLPWGGEILNCCPFHANVMALRRNTTGAPIKAQLLTGEHQCESIGHLTEEERQLNHFPIRAFTSHWGFYLDQQP